MPRCGFFTTFRRVTWAHVNCPIAKTTQKNRNLDSCLYLAPATKTHHRKILFTATTFHASSSQRLESFDKKYLLSFFSKQSDCRASNKQSLFKTKTAIEVSVHIGPTQDLFLFRSANADFDTRRWRQETRINVHQESTDVKRITAEKQQTPQLRDFDFIPQDTNSNSNSNKQQQALIGQKTDQAMWTDEAAKRPIPVRSILRKKKRRHALRKQGKTESFGSQYAQLIKGFFLFLKV